MPRKNPAISVSTKLPTTSFGCVPPGRVSPSSSIGDQALRFSDVAALLSHRELKLHGGQISDVGLDILYSSLCKQIDVGFQEGFTESEVICTVIRTIKPDKFREMLVNKGDLTVDELKRVSPCTYQGQK